MRIRNSTGVTLVRRWCSYAGLLVASGVVLLAGCGGGVFSTSKTLTDPLGLQGRSANMNVQTAVDGLTTQLSANQQGALKFSLNNLSTSGSPYEGMSTMEISQKASLTFSINSSGVLPSTFTLRDVDLRVVVKASEGTTRISPPVEFRYTGFLTLVRQPDGSYRVQENLSFLDELDRYDGSALITILTTGSANTITADVSFAANTSSPNIPSGSTVSLILQFGDSNALVKW